MGALRAHASRAGSPFCQAGGVGARRSVAALSTVARAIVSQGRGFWTGPRRVLTISLFACQQAPFGAIARLRRRATSGQRLPRLAAVALWTSPSADERVPAPTPPGPPILIPADSETRPEQRRADSHVSGLAPGSDSRATRMPESPVWPQSRPRGPLHHHQGQKRPPTHPPSWRRPPMLCPPPRFSAGESRISAWASGSLTNSTLNGALGPEGTYPNQVTRHGSPLPVLVPSPAR